MSDNSLDFEEGYREGIRDCLKAILKVKDADELFDHLAQIQEESAIRTDRILRKSRQGEKE